MSPKVDILSQTAKFVSFSANVLPRSADMGLVSRRWHLERLPSENRGGDRDMRKKTKDLKTLSKRNVAANVHGRLMRASLSRRMSVNPRMSTKQRSDMDRRASFSILYPTV